jgi:hypothetical protein
MLAVRWGWGGVLLISGGGGVSKYRDRERAHKMRENLSYALF